MKAFPMVPVRDLRDDVPNYGMLLLQKKGLGRKRLPSGHGSSRKEKNIGAVEPSEPQGPLLDRTDDLESEQILRTALGL